MSAYAVIKTGGKQYRVKTGDYLKIEKIDGQPGDKVVFDNVLMVKNDDKVELGKPVVAGAKVNAEVVQQGRGEKIKVVKFKRRQNYHRTQGHRQYFTEVKIADIEGVSA